MKSWEVEDNEERVNAAADDNEDNDNEEGEGMLIMLTGLFSLLSLKLLYHYKNPVASNWFVIEAQSLEFTGWEN